MIDIHDLRVVYRAVWPQRDIAVRALDQVSLQIGKSEAVFNYPQHEYTKLLISSAPVIRQSHGRLPKAIGHR
jgi:ABC-type oligopeptide transport system ATPase subunit